MRVRVENVSACKTRAYKRTVVWAHRCYVEHVIEYRKTAAATAMHASHRSALLSVVRGGMHAPGGQMPCPPAISAALSLAASGQRLTAAQQVQLMMYQHSVTPKVRCTCGYRLGTMACRSNLNPGFANLYLMCSLYYPRNSRIHESCCIINYPCCIIMNGLEHTPFLVSGGYLTSGSWLLGLRVEVRMQREAMSTLL